MSSNHDDGLYDSREDDDEDIVLDVVHTSNSRERLEGWRLHLFRERGENLLLSEEQVLPEKVDDPRAYRVTYSKRLWLTSAEVRWLHEQLTSTLAEMDKERS